MNAVLETQPRALNREERDRFSVGFVAFGDPVRFLWRGRDFNIVTGAFSDVREWVSFTREAATEIAELTGTLAVFLE